ncbi:MAG: hypothetical protein ACTS6J_16915, partial [Burkholderiales bacterium]
GQEDGYLVSDHRLSHRYRVVADQVSRTYSKPEMDSTAGPSVFLGQRYARHDYLLANGRISVAYRHTVPYLVTMKAGKSTR